MKAPDWNAHPRSLAGLALAFALVPVWLAVATYRDARNKDARLFDTSAQVLAEQLQRATERHDYFLGVLRDRARGLSESALLAGQMAPPGFDWEEKLPHLIAFGFAAPEGDALVLRWRSDARATVASAGARLTDDVRISTTLKAHSPPDRAAARGCVLDEHKLLMLLAVNGDPARGFIVGWIDLAALCRDETLPLIGERVLAVAPLDDAAPTPTGARRIVVRDDNVQWTAGIVRGENFNQHYGPPAPWLAFLAAGMSAVPLLLLAVLAGRAAKWRAALDTEREISRQQRFFTQSVSHEFRTPLGIILSGADLLASYAERLTPERRNEVLAEIKDNTRRMSAMVEQVLMLGRIESHRLACQPRPENVAALCREISRKNCGGAAIAVNAPDCEAPLDAMLLASILGNLLSNAVKYSPPGKPVTLDAAVDGRQIVFTVRDEGIGIPVDELSRVFDPFHRCANVGDTPGTGLGLAIAQRCTTLHGGTLSIESTPSRGTTAIAILPVT